MLARVTGSIDEEIQARNEYLVTENRVLRNQIKGRLRLTDGERMSLATAGKRLGRKALEEVAQIVRPETILAWHRRLIARKFDGSKLQALPAGVAKSDTVEELVVRLGRENRGWGYRRMVGALKNFEHDVCHQTVANILKKYDMASAPDRRRTMTWREFIRSHAEREECLSKMILVGERSLRHVLSSYITHFHSERNHQEKGNVIRFPSGEDRIGEGLGAIQTRERLGGLLKFYQREGV